MATIGDLLYGAPAPNLPPTPQIPQSPNVDFSQPGMMEQFWNAWQMPGQFTGTPAQMQEIQRLATMQDGNVARAQQVPTPAQPPTQSPAQPAAAPVTAPTDQLTERKNGWTTMMERMRDPNVMGPLQTFFSALSAPMGPGENWASRLGRASSLANIHRSMLDENARNQPREDELRQLELEGKRLDVQGKQADVRGRTVDANFKEATFSDRVAAGRLDVENAIKQGKLHDANMALKALELDLQKQFGAQKAELEMKKIRTDIARSNASAYRDIAAGNKDKKSESDMDKVWQRRVNLAKGTVQGVLRQFRASNPGATVDDFYKWIDENSLMNAELSKIHDDVGILLSEGIDPFSTLETPAGTEGPAIIDAATIRAQQEARRRAQAPIPKQSDGTATPTGGARQDWPKYR